MTMYRTPIIIPWLTPEAWAEVEQSRLVDRSLGINDFTRSRMREQNFYRRIMPPEISSNDELDRSVPTDRPVRVVDAEDRMRAAVAVGEIIDPMDAQLVRSYNNAQLGLRDIDAELTANAAASRAEPMEGDIELVAGEGVQITPIPGTPMVRIEATPGRNDDAWEGPYAEAEDPPGMGW